ncbi:hypothetical protein BDZ89DRAFT_530779 [Hymenopellis radicata]|nr:hypothetical protein BDZ89DRAFT_530779 [Hymenopellis radicata]
MRACGARPAHEVGRAVSWAPTCSAIMSLPTTTAVPTRTHQRREDEVGDSQRSDKKTSINTLMTAHSRHRTVQLRRQQQHHYDDDGTATLKSNDGDIHGADDDSLDLANSENSKCGRRRGPRSAITSLLRVTIQGGVEDDSRLHGRVEAG